MRPSLPDMIEYLLLRQALLTFLEVLMIKLLYFECVPLEFSDHSRSRPTFHSEFVSAIPHGLTKSSFLYRDHDVLNVFKTSENLQFNLQ